MSNASINEYRHEKAPPDLIERLHSMIGIRRGEHGINEFRELLRRRLRENRNLALSLSLCMGCGACLTVCSAYLATRNIKNSPLGRIALARSLMRGSVNENLINEAYTYF
ncbi:(Fe-S)-binding protein [Vulcanisaeta distributa]|uniref:(Fe-S)-binding protein n=1 Tax=Vulcanisaeta distributa TaxID=164451 RepID=UPI000AA8B353|nr:(Fe-S)-binding protein [Vulcanisaeta distributa]